MNFYSLTVKNVEQLTTKSIKVDLFIPTELISIFKWKPGQFIRFQFLIDGQKVEREYSICTATYEKYISVAIKKTKTAFISEYVQNNIKAGDKISVSPPMGTFGIPSRPNEKRTLVAFSAGSGITPLMSIVKDTLYNEKGVNFFLFYGNSNEKEVMFKEELEELQKKYSQNFFLHYFYSQQETEDKFFKGKLDGHKVDLIINQIVDWDEVDEALICGPKDMIINLANVIYSYGIPKKNIHYELYEPVEKVFHDDKIQRSTVKEVKVTFTYEGKTQTMNWINNGSSLLDALLVNGINAPYSCKGGVCGSCQCSRVQGEVILGENLVLTEEDIKNKKILTCVAQPKTNTLVIDMDN
ncbi:2Fe-2S iron-sulfur cluster-binding protein [Apibacter adventoris]|uniref:Nitric oxide dioxygenase n=1 Tax=Apibacter adventoris TaxID=1679466 RepID=A0A2S8AGK3_9FLAO|nr:2Fe-2S iron-sulfur cluster-binding protein [Apibacter adventoris]PQL95428.1 nitric oxide dioxygenase [Apibacter adventoris]